MVPFLYYMVMSCIIGIDPSLNSTGVVVKTENNYKYYVIGSHTEKQFIDDAEKYGVTYLQYEKLEKIKNYCFDELVETARIDTIAKNIAKIVFAHKLENPQIYMEGCALRALGKVESLFALNFLIRIRIQEVFSENEKYQLFIKSPSENKKHFSGKGNASKELMVSTFLEQRPEFSGVKAKWLDDIADAYSFCQY